MKSAISFLIFILTCKISYTQNFISDWSKLTLPANWKYSVVVDDERNVFPSKLGCIIFNYNDSNSSLTLIYNVYKKNSNETAAFDLLVKEYMSSRQKDEQVIREFTFLDNVYLLDTSGFTGSPSNLIKSNLIFNLGRYIEQTINEHDSSEWSISNYIAVLSVLVLIIGWFINNQLNRKHEIAKERLKIKIETLKSCLSLFYLMQQNDRFYLDQSFQNLFEIAYRNIMSFGKKDEIEKMNVLKSLLLKNKFSEILPMVEVLIDDIRNSLRNELKF